MRVMSKSGFVRLQSSFAIDDDGEPVYEAAIGYEFDYIVREENGDQILLRLRDKKEGWVEKESLVLMKEASEFFTKALDADPDNAVLYRQLRAHARQSTGGPRRARSPTRPRRSASSPTRRRASITAAGSIRRRRSSTRRSPTSTRPWS